MLLINDSVSSYKSLNLGAIKVAFTMVCKDHLFPDVYFSANALYFVRTGRATLMSPQHQITLGPGEIAHIKQHTKLAIQKQKDSQTGAEFSAMIVYLLPQVVTEFLPTRQGPTIRADHTQVPMIALGKPADFQTFCDSMLPLFDRPRADNQLLKAKTLEALQLLSRQCPDLLPVLMAPLKPVKIDLYEFMTQMPLANYSVPELAQLTARSLSAFKREFKRIFNTTPYQWMLNQKIEYAQRLLQESGLKASDFYLYLGFQELSHFSAAFKKRKGRPPSRL